MANDAVDQNLNQDLDTGGGESTQGTDQGNQKVMDLTDDVLVRYPGRKEPIKYGELSKQLQAAETKKNQELAKQRLEHDRAVKEWTAAKQAEEARLQQIAAQLLARQGGGQQGKGDYRSKLAAKTWLTGQDAGELYDQVGTTLGQIAQAIEERDQVISAIYNQYLKLAEVVNALNARSGGQDFEGKIQKWVDELGYGPEFRDLAKEIYLAYEGEDLDQEFPSLFKSRVDAITAAIRAGDKKRVEAAKQSPFKLPGKGGGGVAGKLAGLKGNESATEQADLIWDALQEGPAE